MMTWANLLTALRVLSLVPIALAVRHQFWLAASALFTLAVLTDYFDGKIARKLDQTSPFGGLFDHATDAVFVTTCCWALASLDLINPYLVVLIPVAFVQYMLDSKALAGVPLRMSAIGRANGIGYYVLVGTAVGAQLLQWSWLAQPIVVAGYVLVVSTLLSILDRAITLAKHKYQQPSR